MEQLPSSALQLVIASCACCVLWWMLSRFNSGERHPPGPPGYPLLGYLKPIKSPVWEAYRQWSLDYNSGIIRFNVLGTNIIVANDYKTASDLFEKRSSVYSDRPISSMIMVRELVGFDWSTAVAPYGPWWRDSRKALQTAFNQQAIQSYRAILRRVAHRFLSDVQHTPGTVREHVRFMFGSMAIEVSYGVEVQSPSDPLIKTAEHAMWAANQCVTPGAYLVDTIPILKYVPEWFPGAHFKRQAREWKTIVHSMAHTPYNAIKAETISIDLFIDRTDLPNCAAKTMSEQIFVRDAGSKQYNNEDVVRGTLGTVFGAMSDTSTAALDGFILKMALYPHIQKKAQATVDRVCRDRAPDFSDISSLPYVQALVKECLRCNPVAPFGLPHMATMDDVYDGYYIPAKSTVIANIWAILHDPQVYKNPDAFDPERFLIRNAGSDELDFELDANIFDPEMAVFGLGRRICPGRHLAHESLCMTFALLLAFFNISQATDENGIPVPLHDQYTDTFICSPKEFRCVIEPRSPKHAELITTLVPQ